MRASSISLPTVLLLLSSLISLPGTGQDVDLEALRATLTEAQAAWFQSRDPELAMELLNRAVTDSNGHHEATFARASFLIEVAPFVTDEGTRTQLQQAARSDFSTVVELVPNTTLGGVSRDRIRILDGLELFVDDTPECDQAATEAWAEAERLFNAGQAEESISFYRSALEGCSNASIIAVHHADAFFVLGRFEEARDAFIDALELNQWSRSGHRFLADTYDQLDDGEGSLRHSALAIICDPTYEAAWNQFASSAAKQGQRSTRLWAERGATLTEKDDGDVDITILVDDEDEDEDASLKDDSTAWMMYAIARAGALAESREAADDSTTDSKATSKTRYAVELEATELALESLGPEPLEDQSSFWAMMQRAQAAGYLEEAVYLHLIDDEMVVEYGDFRDSNRDRLLAYLLDVVLVEEQKAD